MEIVTLKKNRNFYMKLQKWIYSKISNILLVFFWAFIWHLDRENPITFSKIKSVTLFLFMQFWDRLTFHRFISKNGFYCDLIHIVFRRFEITRRCFGYSAVCTGLPVAETTPLGDLAIREAKTRQLSARST